MSRAWRFLGGVVLMVAACGGAAPTSDSGSTAPTSGGQTTGEVTTSTATTIAPTTVSPTTSPTTPPARTRPPTTPPASTPPASTRPPTTPPATTRPPTTPPASTRPPTTPPPTTPPSGKPSKLIYSLPTSQKVVAITIDAGSDLGYTDQILDTLAAEGVHATFGITGAWADDHPAAVERMADEGHQVMNHSYAHRSFTGASAGDPLLTAAARQADLATAEATLKALTGRTTKPFFRPPYGDSDAGVLVDVGAAGYAYTVMWTVDSGGWKGLSADEIIARVLDRVTPGAIIVFHVGSASKDVDAIGPIIDELGSRGYTFVTLSAAYSV